MLTGFADIMNHRKHGLFGAIIIESPESKYFCNECGVETEKGAEEVIISNPEEFDTEDQNQKGFNYRSERYENRLKRNKDLTKVMDSCVHGDPATPLFRAYTGDNMKIRLIMPVDKPRNIGFVIHGHSWRQQDKDPLSPIVSTAGAISVGNVFNYTLENGANCLSGDYCYRSGSFRWDVEQGMWGILRVYDE